MPIQNQIGVAHIHVNFLNELKPSIVADAKTPKAARHVAHDIVLQQIARDHAARHRILPDGSIANVRACMPRVSSVGLEEMAGQSAY